MLEQRAIPFEQSLQLLGPIPVEPRSEDQMVGALEHLNRIDLHEPELLDGAAHRRRGRGTGGIRQESLTREEQAPRVLHADFGRPRCRHAPTVGEPRDRVLSVAL